MTERDSLLSMSVSKMSLIEIFKQFKSSPDGLSSAEAKKVRENVGLNQIPPPLSAPAWLCCLLPCLLRTKSMEAYHECVPEHAQVKRNKNFINLDANSIVPGDIVKIESGMRVPADIRIIESRGCIFDTSSITGKTQRLNADPHTSADVFTDSPNMGFLGYLCTSGECIGVVVAIGEDTVIAKLINRKEWPLQK